MSRAPEQFACPECGQDMCEGPKPGRKRCPLCDQALPRKRKSPAPSPLLPLVRELREALAKVDGKQTEALELLRKVGYVYGNSEDRMQKLVFTLYTYLVSLSQMARPLLEDADKALAGEPQEREGEQWVCAACGRTHTGVCDVVHGLITGESRAGGKDA